MGARSWDGKIGKGRWQRGLAGLVAVRIGFWLGVV